MNSDRLAAALVQWRDAPSPGTERALVEAITALATGVARAMRVAAADAEDVAQTTALRVLPHLRSGAWTAAGPDREVGAVVVTAQNLCRDLYQQRKRDAEKVRAAAREPTLAADADVEGASGGTSDDASDDPAARAQALARLHQLLPEMPPSPRAVLEEMYVRGRTVEQLVEREVASPRAPVLQQRPDESMARYRKRLRNYFDQNHKRGRDWLLARMPVPADRRPSGGRHD